MSISKFEQAKTLAQNGQNKQAYEIFTELLRTEPRNTNFLIWSAKTAPNLDVAHKCILRAAKLEPNNPAVQEAARWLLAQKEEVGKPKAQNVGAVPQNPSAQVNTQQTASKLALIRKPGILWAFAGFVLFFVIIVIGVMSVINKNKDTNYSVAAQPTIDLNKFAISVSPTAVSTVRPNLNYATVQPTATATPRQVSTNTPAPTSTSIPTNTPLAISTVEPTLTTNAASFATATLLPPTVQPTTPPVANSWDGRKLVYTSTRNGYDGVYIYNFGTGSESYLAGGQSGWNCSEPTWFASPPGTNMQVMMQCVRNGRGEIIVINQDGTNASTYIAGTNPATSLSTYGPGISGFSYLSEPNSRCGGGQLVTIIMDGPKRELGCNANPKYGPQTSAAGLVAWSEKRNNQDVLIISGIDGSNQRIVALNSQNIRFPRWSPDGRQVVFNTGEGKGLSQIWLYELANQKFTQLTFDHYNSRPNWTAKGEIIFGSDRDKTSSSSADQPSATSLYIMSANGGNIRRLPIPNEEDNWAASLY